MKVTHLLTAALLALAPLTGALAQGTGPTVKADPKESTTMKGGSNDAMKPGATGKTVVPGTNSTVASDSKATAETKAGATGGSGGGK